MRAEYGALPTITPLRRLLAASPALTRAEVLHARASPSSSPTTERRPSVSRIHEVVMPRNPMRVCNVSGCPTISDSSRCPVHNAETMRSNKRGIHRYDTAGHRHFRTAVIAKHPVCVLCGRRMTTIADHYPTSRRALIDQGLDPNDPQYGRGLCKPCHDSETAKHQPGGWNNRYHIVDD